MDDIFFLTDVSYVLTDVVEFISLQLAFAALVFFLLFLELEDDEETKRRI